MARSARRMLTNKMRRADRSRHAGAGLDALADLRQALRAKSADSAQKSARSETRPATPAERNDASLFRAAMRDVAPLRGHHRAVLETNPPRPEPIKRSEDEQAALRESMDAPLSLEDRLEMGDEAVFLRPGLPRRILTDLRRSRWVLQAELDLHGLNRDEARSALAEFLRSCLIRGHRCVRVIHGKGLGSPGKESILKRLSRGWLAQREEILAFCQANPNQGGSGALMVLLRGQPAAGRANDPS